jgi:hypothetical protein
VGWNIRQGYKCDPENEERADKLKQDRCEKRARPKPRLLFDSSVTLCLCGEEPFQLPEKGTRGLDGTCELDECSQLACIVKFVPGKFLNAGLNVSVELWRQQQIPSLQIFLIPGMIALRTQRDRPLPPNLFLRNDVPLILANRISRYAAKAKAPRLTRGSAKY